MTTRTGRVVVQAVYRAATSRVSVCLSGALTISALLFQSGLLAAVAAGGYVVSVAVDLGRGRRWRAAVEELRHRPPVLPSRDSYSDPKVGEFLVRLERARAERQSALESLPGPTRAGAETLAQGAFGLEEAAVAMLAVLERVNRYLGVDARGPVRADLVRLEQAAASAPSPAVRAEYGRSVAVSSLRLGSLDQVDHCQALLQAKLEGIVGTLEALPVRLVALELRQCTAVVLENGLPIEPIVQELATLEEAASAVGRPAAL